MKPSHYIAIVVRLFSVFIFIYSIRPLGLFVEFISNGSFGGSLGSLAYAVATTFLPLLIAAFLWVFPVTVTRAIVKPELDLPLEAVPPSSILVVLVISIGAYVLFYALSDAFYWVSLWVMSTGEGLGVELEFGADNKAYMWATAFEIVLSSCLILRAKTLAYALLSIAR